MEADFVYRQLLKQEPDGNWLAIGCQEEVQANKGIVYKKVGTIAKLTAEPSPHHVVLVGGTSAGRFGSAEQEICAAAIVLVCSDANMWGSFTREEVFKQFTALVRGQNSTFAFDQLRLRGFIYSEDGENFRVTTGFLERLAARGS